MHRNLSALRFAATRTDPRNWDDTRFADQNDLGASGTGTFLVEVIDLIHKTVLAKWKAAGHGEKKIDMLWNEYVPKHLLMRLHGYELLMAPYSIAHVKIGLKLYETGYRFGSDERAGLSDECARAIERCAIHAQLPAALAHKARASF